MAEDQEEASYIQQLADKSGAAELLKFKATVETALSGSPDMQALAKQTFAEATMHFKELPGDALRIFLAGIKIRKRRSLCRGAYRGHY